MKRFKGKTKSEPGCGTAFLLVLAVVFIAGFIHSAMPHERNRSSSDYGNIFIPLLIVALIIFLCMRVSYHRKVKAAAIDTLNWPSYNRALSNIATSLYSLTEFDVELHYRTFPAVAFGDMRFVQKNSCWFIERSISSNEKSLSITMGINNCRFAYHQRHHQNEISILSSYEHTVILDPKGKGVISVNTMIPDYVDKTSAMKHLDINDNGVLKALGHWK